MLVLLAMNTNYDKAQFKKINLKVNFGVTATKFYSVAHSHWFIQVHIFVRIF